MGTPRFAGHAAQAGRLRCKRRALDFAPAWHDRYDAQVHVMSYRLIGALRAPACEIRSRSSLTPSFTDDVAMVHRNVIGVIPEIPD
jgi:hypothetical protein